MCMEDYVQPTLKGKPTHIILHVGMNDVPTKKDSGQVVENTVNLEIKLKRNCEVSISGITARNNQYQRKAADVKYKKRIAKKIYSS